jgi:sugar phosphate isomerase/epimerase
MRIGIFAKSIPRVTLAGTCAAIGALGCDTVQFNMSVVGLPTLPLGIADALCDQIASTVRAHGLTMAALSATGNIIHPDLTQRQAVLDGMHTLIDAAPLLGCQVLTISTGTCHPADMWAAHPDNATPQAWATMCQSVRMLLPHAERVGVRLAFEPEQGNVVRTAAQARTLLDTMASPALGVVLDVANLLTVDTIPHQHAIIDEAMTVLARDIVVVHAKELPAPPHTGACAPGMGVVDFGYLASALRRINYRGAVIMHGVDEAATPHGLAHLRRVWRVGVGDYTM